MMDNDGVSFSDKLKLKKEKLEEELKKANEAIVLLEKNPNITKILDVLKELYL